MAIKRGEWIDDGDLSRYFKGVYNGAKFIRETFGFNDYFTKGKSYYYRKSSSERIANTTKLKNTKTGLILCSRPKMVNGAGFKGVLYA
ncbi:hypothetical protein [Dyadobacter frigoris]|uniref:Uncharacterized protein n=1 Tax=Dyadobacter frigoris TaxID=2576211 RepID=A0A4U6D7W3_9BACT|nr:hypothetical protein [Dyadobacter frigoris]TKT92635.1 hypothetical protein FDK13_07405 [Dyadobacter frigoris]GLU51532.1 hypothetical protein Dfri01_09930 [Dyadobacter frigoris]